MSKRRKLKKSSPKLNPDELWMLQDGSQNISGTPFQNSPVNGDIIMGEWRSNWLNDIRSAPINSIRPSYDEWLQDKATNSGTVMSKGGKIMKKRKKQSPSYKYELGAAVTKDGKVPMEGDGEGADIGSILNTGVDTIFSIANATMEVDPVTGLPLYGQQKQEFDALMEKSNKLDKASKGLGAAAAGIQAIPVVGQIGGAILGAASGITKMFAKKNSNKAAGIEQDKVNADKWQNLTTASSTEGINSGMMGKGGKISKNKASEILKDGTVHGKKLTKKQKRFMQAVAHGMKPMGDGGNVSPFQEYLNKYPNRPHTDTLYAVNYDTDYPFSDLSPGEQQRVADLNNAQDKTFGNMNEQTWPLRKAADDKFMESPNEPKNWPFNRPLPVMAEGGMPEQSLIDIEKGELEVFNNKGDWKVKTEFEGPRFSRHASNPSKEPVGNFVQATEGNVIIPRKFKKAFKTADRQNDGLRKESIIQKVLQDQKEREKFKMGKGGIVKCEDGILVDNEQLPLDNTSFGQQFNQNAPTKVPGQTASGLFAPKGKTTFDRRTYPFKTDYNDTPSFDAFKNQPKEQGDFKAEARDMFNTALTSLPAAYNLGVAAFSPVDYLRPEEFYDEYTNKERDLMANRKINNQAVINRIQSQERLATDYLKGNSLNPRANIANTVARTQGTIADAELQGQIANQTFRGEEAEFLSRKGAERANTRWMTEQENAQRKEAKKAHLNAGITQVSDIAQSKEKERNMRYADAVKTQALSDLSANYDIPDWIRQEYVSGSMTYKELIEALEPLQKDGTEGGTAKFAKPKKNGGRIY